jgi:NAD(P)-dependent dehydrogenase (short-subunit alcohol dehydrogenase family)
MKELASKVCVITGAANGIGFALAQAFAEEHMNIVLADIDSKALQAAVSRIRGFGTEAIGVIADVSDAAAVQHLAEATQKEFGTVDLLCNNAGLFCAAASAWEHSAESWERSISVNLHGVINGLNSFVPIMLRHGREGHIVNVASLAGHRVQPFFAPYHVTKFGVTALTESLALELEFLDAKVGVSLICPGLTHTNILSDETEANMPISNSEQNEINQRLQSVIKKGIVGGMPAEEVARKTVDAVRSNKFYVFTHERSVARLKTRFDRIIAGSNPALDDEIRNRFN